MAEQTIPVRLFQVTDTHCYASDDAPLEWTQVAAYPNRALQRVLEHLRGLATDHQALLVTGDLAQQETDATYLRLNQIFNGFALPVHVIPGNHDLPDLMRQCLTGKVQMPERVVFGVWHCLLLDTHAPQQPDGHLDAAQFQRLETQLQAIPTDHFGAIFMHHHPVDIGSAWMDVMGLRQKAQFWALLERFPQVRTVFNGHIHQEFSGAHTYPGGRSVAVFGTPSTSVQLKPLSPTFQFDHIRPAWRDISLFPDGRVETQVHYLTPPA